MSYRTQPMSIQDIIKKHNQRITWINGLIRRKEEEGLTPNDEERLLRWECEAAELEEEIEAFRRAPVNRVGYTIRSDEVR